MESKDPDCYDGTCTADPNIGRCIECGALMFEENGSWFHHEQEDIPFEQRKSQNFLNHDKRTRKQSEADF